MMRTFAVHGLVLALLIPAASSPLVRAQDERPDDKKPLPKITVSAMATAIENDQQIILIRVKIPSRHFLLAYSSEFRDQSIRFSFSPIACDKGFNKIEIPYSGLAIQKKVLDGKTVSAYAGEVEFLCRMYHPPGGTSRAYIDVNYTLIREADGEADAAAGQVLPRRRITVVTAPDPSPIPPLTLPE